MSTEEVTSVDYSTYFTGRVKWFNNKSGYGFITVVVDGSSLPEGVESLVGEDIFSHHSNIVVDKEQFRYLVQGEYVSFTVSTVENDSHKYQSGHICGVRGGELLCETREEQRLLKPVTQRVPVRKGRGPREGEEWSEPRQRRGRDSRNLSEEH